MIACADVYYKNDSSATAACIEFERWESSVPFKESVVVVKEVEPYVPGSFFLRELPCILEILKSLEDKPNTIVVDGYVWLGEGSPGLGARLYEALGCEIPVIGVAKSRFKGADNAIRVIRGKSSKPLYVTAAGLPDREAAEYISAMAGEFRIPLLLKRLDQLSRGVSQNTGW